MRKFALLVLILWGCEGSTLQKIRTRPDTNCNGIDEDQNGEIDDAYPVTKQCGTDEGMCSKGWIVCLDGEEVCSGAVGPREGPDLCDGTDSDCDGEVDEDFESSFCYGEVHFSPCHPGVIECHTGRKVCVGRVDPSPEVCDHVDNDCNGLIDDVSVGTTPTKVDVVFLFDISLSVDDILQWRIAAVREWIASIPKNFDMNFWLFELSGREFDDAWGPNPICHPEPDAPVAPCLDFWEGLGSLDGRVANSREPYYDALSAMATEPAWRDNARKVLVAFLDDDNLDSENTELEAAFWLSTTGVQTFVFSRDPPHYEIIAHQTRGKSQPTSSGASGVVPILGQLLHASCL